MSQDKGTPDTLQDVLQRLVSLRGAFAHPRAQVTAQAFEELLDILQQMTEILIDHEQSHGGRIL